MIDAVPLLVLAVGVKVAVNILPSVVNGTRVPPVQFMKLEIIRGTSEKVNVMVAVSSALRKERLLVMLQVGGKVS